MDKKKFKHLESEDLKGFEEFIEGQPSEGSFLPRGVGGGTKKNEVGFEHFTFLTTDSDRLMKLKFLLSDKLPFSAKFDQSAKLIRDQNEELKVLRKKLFDFLDKKGSPYRKSLSEVFNNYFEPPTK